MTSKSPIEKRLHLASRRRFLPSGGFSWIDRRFVRDGFLAGLTGPEALLYFFLVAASDKDGLSFFGDRRTTGLLKLSEAALEQARRGLERKDLIVYRAPLYQVLSLPEAPSVSSLAELTLDPGTAPPHRAPTEPVPVGDIIQRMFKVRGKSPPAEPPPAR